MKENTIPAVEKTIRMLEFLSGVAEGATQTELAKELRISGATCYRIIQSLLKYGWLKKHGSSFELGSGLLPLSSKVCQAQQWQEKIKEPLARLAQVTKLSVKLSVRRGRDEYFTLFRVDSPLPMAVTGRLGASFPLIEGSVAGALLSLHSKKAVDKIIRLESEQLLEKTNPEILYKRISECRKKGFCSNDGQGRWGVEVISAPIILHNEVLASISVLGMREDFFNNREQIEKNLLVARQESELLLAE